MTQSQTTTTWIIVIIVAIVLIGGIWWYTSAQNAALNNISLTNLPDNNTVVTKSSEKGITSFSFQSLNPAVNGTIDQNTHTITLTVPKDTDVKNLTPSVVISDYATLSPSSLTAKDFTNPVIYTVTAEDGSTQNYTVTVKMAAQ